VTAAVYPVIEEPRKQPDGAYIIRVHRGPDDVEERTAPDLKKGRELMVALQNAATLLLPRPAAPAPLRPTGRPSLFTAEVRARLIEAFGDCMTHDMIAACAGISSRTLARWLEDGRRALEVWEHAGEDYHEPDGDRAYREFVLDARAAEAEKQRALIRIVTGPKSDPNWTRAMTFLERRWWKEFSRRFVKDDDKSEPISVIFRRPESKDVKSDPVIPLSIVK